MEIGKKKPSSKNEINEKVGMIKQMIGSKFLEIKEGFQLQNKETLQELKEQNEELILRLAKMEEDILAGVKTEVKETERAGEHLLTMQGEKLSKLEEMLGNFDMQASMFELQGSKMESILSNFPKLENNIVGKINENTEEKLLEFSTKIERLEKQISKTHYYVNLFFFFLVLVQISSITYLLYFFMNR